MHTEAHPHPEARPALGGGGCVTNPHSLGDSPKMSSHRSASPLLFHFVFVFLVAAKSFFSKKISHKNSTYETHPWEVAPVISPLMLLGDHLTPQITPQGSSTQFGNH